jgi:hypothetical protein
VKTTKYGKAELVLMEWFHKSWPFIYQLRLKKCVALKNASKSLMNVRLKMWFEGENELFNGEFI